MVRYNDTSEIRTPLDILHRSSRPQRNSSYIPRARDWRYATGVYQHEDFDGAPKDRTIWDELDFDFQIGVFGREKRRVIDGVVTQDGKRKDVAASVSGVGSEVDSRSETISLTPGLTPTKSGGLGVKKSQNVGEDAMEEVVSKALKPTCISVAKYRRAEVVGNGEGMFELTSFVIRLKFTGGNVAKVQRIVDDILHPLAQPSPSLLDNQMTPQSAKSLQTPVTGSTASSVCTSTLDSLEPIQTSLLFEREWVDETQNFNMKKVQENLRDPDDPVDEIPPSFHWYAGAVPIDAIFPPGVPLSAKEIHAYYPHHVRRKGVILRLANNGYRGPDIVGIQNWFRNISQTPVTGAQMNGWMRDSFRRTIPSFNTTDWNGRPDWSMYMDDLQVGKWVENHRRRFVVPTFDNLLKGLEHLPSGLDARGLTQCLVWYLNVHNMFSPRLEMNVLHTQSLIRALRVSLKPYGSQNLDIKALEEWRSKGNFEERKVEDEERHLERKDHVNGELGKSRLEINKSEESVRLHLTLPTRRVLTFPFLAMQSLVEEALKMGIEKAERHEAARLKQEEEFSPEETNVKEDAQIMGEGKEVRKDEERESPSRIPKRLPSESHLTPPPAKRQIPINTLAGPRIAADSRVPGGPRTPLTPLYAKSTSSADRGYYHPRFSSHFSGTRYRDDISRRPQGEPYGSYRRDLAHRYGTYQRPEVSYSQNARYSQGLSHPQGYYHPGPSASRGSYYAESHPYSYGGRYYR